MITSVTTSSTVISKLKFFKLKGNLENKNNCFNSVNFLFVDPKLRAMHEAKFVHDYIYRRGFSCTEMIYMYVRWGNSNLARETFDRMEKNVIQWTAIIGA